jgi:Tetracyclin repressor-like, C-terminal domain
VLEQLRRANRTLSSPTGDILRGLLAGAAADPELLATLREQSGDGGSGLWLTLLGRAVARDVLVEIADEVYLPLVRGRGAPPAAQGAGA